jgi:hypothetical protein
LAATVALATAVAATQLFTPSGVTAGSISLPVTEDRSPAVVSVRGEPLPGRTHRVALGLGALVVGDRLGDRCLEVLRANLGVDDQVLAGSRATQQYLASCDLPEADAPGVVIWTRPEIKVVLHVPHIPSWQEEGRLRSACSAAARRVVSPSHSTV